MPTKKKKCIVLVEDEPTLANLIEGRLKEQGYEVRSATDGKSGLQLIREAKPDLVLLDVMLPGLKGFDILEKLHKEDGLLPGLPIIIISNSGDSIEVERALRMGVRDYLVKVNFNPNEVIEKVNNALEEDENKNKQKAKKPKWVKGNRVLIVEDDTLLSGMLEREFVEKRYEVYKAQNAEKARGILAIHDIDVMVLDLVLPDEHGLSFLKELRKRGKTKNIPVIIASNLGQQEEIEQGLKAGAVDYVVKTNTVPGQIVEKVDALLQKGRKDKKQ